jgi:hypothetical protein
MKKVAILLCALVLLRLLVGCGILSESSETSPGESNETVTYQLKITPEDRSQSIIWPSFVETPEGYYYRWDNLAYFCPRGGSAFYPLCSKPNCQHKDRNCNAWCGVFGYYDGALYAAETIENNKISLVRMNLDGTGHQVVATLDSPAPRSSSYSFTFHHGKLYIAAYASQDLPLEEQEDHLIVVDLSNFSQKEPLAEFLDTAKLPSVLSNFYQDKLYGCGTGENRKPETENDYKLLELDAAMGTARSLVPGHIDRLYVTDTTLFYFEKNNRVFNAVNGTDYAEGDPGFRELDLRTGEIKDCGLPLEDIYWAFFDEDYVYAFSPKPNDGSDYTFYFLSRDYKLLDQISLKNSQTVYAATSDRIFLSGNGSKRTPISYYIDKAQIGSHNLKLISIETVG